MAKPRKQKLKVFRTPIGFHDAYVSAPSQKAALEAWGASTNLFTAGTAELVTDAKLTREPLAHPGQVLKKPRGSAKEHFAALGKSPHAARASREPLSPAKARGARRKPSRAALDRAEAAVAALEKRQAAERGALEREWQALNNRREAMEEKQRVAIEKAMAKRDAAEARYREALADWEG